MIQMLWWDTAEAELETSAVDASSAALASQLGAHLASENSPKARMRRFFVALDPGLPRYIDSDDRRPSEVRMSLDDLKRLQALLHQPEMQGLVTIVGYGKPIEGHVTVFGGSGVNSSPDGVIQVVNIHWEDGIREPRP
jgi:hypothetical protein